MFRHWEESGGPGELERIRDPYGVFSDAYQAAVEAMQQGAPEDLMHEKFRNADAAARQLDDTAKQGEALGKVTELERRWRFGTGEDNKDKSPGGVGFDNPLESGKF